MYKAFYSQAGDLLLFPLFAMFLFIGVWTLAVVRTYRRSARTRLDAESMMPLADDESVVPAGPHAEHTAAPARAGGHAHV